ncbi:glycosyltransferase [Salinibacter sp.]|uniref:glycosyltransferase n=1 Tax=Salinibacter sp. TaxID=2065818 RepID=UPI0021E9810B|nr:glycosyltransferase [Salinibacter sp.]
MDISVVLCTYNNAERLRITLQSFCRLNEPEKLDWELVTVNNNSTDDTETVIRSFDDQLPIRYVYEPEQGLSRARNAGLDFAGGELIVFTDDDVKPNSDWLTAYWEAYRERPEGYYFGGPIESEYEGEPPDEDLLRAAPPSVAGLDYGPDARILSPEEIFVGANWACPAGALKEVGMFDESKGLNAQKNAKLGEEIDLMSKLSEDMKGWYVTKAKIKHFVPSSKSNVEHVVSRNLMGLDKKHLKNNKKPKKVFGIYVGQLLRVIVYLLKWVSRYILGLNWKKEYVKYKWWLRIFDIYQNK